MWRLTAPLVRRAVGAHRVAVLAVATGGVASGFVATARSLMEAGIISYADERTRQTPGDLGPRSSVLLDGSDTDGWVERITHWLLDGRGVGQVIAAYVAVTLVGIVITLGTNRARETISSALFTSLFGGGLRAALRNTGITVGPNEPGGLSGAVQQGARAVSSGWAFVISASQNVFALITIVATLSGVDLGFALACLLVVGGLVGSSVWQARLLARRREEFDEQRKDLFALTDDTLSNRDVLLANERDAEFAGKLDTWADGVARTNRTLSVREQDFQTLSSTLFDAGRLAVVGVVLIAAVSGSGVSTVSGVYFFIAIYSRLLNPVFGLLSGYGSFRRSAATSKTLLDLLRARPAPAPAPVAVRGTEAPDRSDTAAAVVFTDVAFAFAPDEPVLHRCSFRVPAGRVTVVLGRSGGGKTTLARLALGFLRPGTGTVEVLGRDVDDWAAPDLLARMSYLAQARHVVEGTLRENLFVAEGFPEQDLLRVLQDVGLASDDDGARRALDRQSRDLSEGQKQRLALARILVDRSEVAILDEPLAGVDALTFVEINTLLASWLAEPGRTVVLISHRPALTAHASHVVVLDGGTVVEEGDVDALLADPTSRYSGIRAAERAELVRAR